MEGLVFHNRMAATSVRVFQVWRVTFARVDTTAESLIIKIILIVNNNAQILTK
jgi:hypothetical protein